MVKKSINSQNSEISLRPIEISVETPENKNKPSGLKFKRLFTKEGLDPYEQEKWERRSSLITDEKGNVISQITEVEVPTSWSQLATDILAHKYLRKAGVPGKEGREVSARQAIDRIVRSLADFGEKFGYFNAENKQIFSSELTHLLVTQKAAFNSPVWFNCGLYHQYGITGQGGSYYWNFAKARVESTATAYRNPQCSACFILSIEDTLPSIFELIKTESHIFKYGSGSGVNFSPLRSRYEKLSGGGYSSGLMSFLRVFDRAAGATKSGGTTRRAAKMVVVNIEHPEIVDFIEWKAKEEKKAAALIEAGYEADFNGEAYQTVSGQNSNNSVRVSDEFMRAVETDGEWQTRYITTQEPHKTFRARELMDKIAQAAWHCADPGLQFDTTINSWHTCPNTSRINASNPCSEYMFIDNSACNLASINLVRFMDKQGNFDIKAFRQACRIVFIAQEIIVDFSSYPTELVAKNSHDFRPLGLGYANLGSLLMRKGIPYDSDEGRTIAGALTAIMTGHAYKTSAEIAAVKKPFEGYLLNRAPMLEVIKRHRSQAYKLPQIAGLEELVEAAKQDWDEALALGEQFGYRNAQATLLAPTGTIGLLMDCDTTGIEPEFALVKLKKLAGGGSIKIANGALRPSLEALGYNEREIDDIITYALGSGSLETDAPINRATLSAKGIDSSTLDLIERNLKNVFDIRHAFTSITLPEEVLRRLNIPPATIAQPNFSLLRHLGFDEADIEESNEKICGTQTIEGAPHLKKEHYAVFDCANKCGSRGQRFLSPMSHVKMMAAVQPFLSGAISKTINLPNEATVADVADIYMQSWKLGLKAIAIYRDGSKLSQPLNARREKKEEKERSVESQQVPSATVGQAVRRQLPDERQSITHKFNISGYKGYITIGLYDEGTPGEIFITMSKQGSVIRGLLDSFATTMSVSLQYGVPLKVLLNKLVNTRFEPSGLTTNPQIRLAKSIIDYIGRYIGIKFLSPEDQLELGIATPNSVAINQAPLPIKNTPSASTVDSKTNLSEEESPDMSETVVSSDAPPCPNCGSMTTKTGTCYTCLSCGSTTGGCS